MNGIHILSQSVVDNVPLKNGLFALGIGLIIIAVIYCLIILLNIFSHNKEYISALFIAVIGIVCILLSYEVIIDRHVKYKVTISKNVKYIEFTDKYEVINKEGTIYTIRLKHKVNN